MPASTHHLSLSPFPVGTAIASPYLGESLSGEAQRGLLRRPVWAFAKRADRLGKLSPLLKSLRVLYW